MKKNNLILALEILIIIMSLWIGITSLIYNLKYPEKTKMQVFLHLPKHFILNFSK